jgi:thiol peroxidase
MPRAVPFADSGIVPVGQDFVAAAAFIGPACRPPDRRNTADTEFMLDHASFAGDTSMGRHGAVTFKGNPLTLVGDEVQVGSPAPDFDLTSFGPGGMEHIKKADLLGKPAFISVVPSLDTPVCQVQTKTFNKRLAGLGDKITALTVSLDLPFAMNRFCGAEDIKGMKNGSDYMDRSFGTHWGVLIDELKILARAVFVLDARGVVQYAQVVKEVASEPDYDAALAALEKLV